MDSTTSAAVRRRGMNWRLTSTPLLIEWLVFLVLFAVMYAAGQRGVSTRHCAWLVGIFQGVYMVASLALGVVITRRNARALVFAGIIVPVLFGVQSLLTTSFAALAIGMTGLGIGQALFFNAFQAFMRGQSAPGGLARSIGLYTLAWSLGCGLGPLASGLVFRLGLYPVALLAVLLGAAIFAMLAGYRPRPPDLPSAEECVEQGSDRARPVTPAYLAAGWIMIFTIMFVQRPLLTLLPAIGAQSGVSASMMGTILFLHLLVQALFGCWMARYRDLLYRRTPLVAAHLGAALLFAVLWRWPTVMLYYCGLGLLGFYAGFVYFASVYYASNSGRRSFNVGINEFLVGLGSVLGLLVTDLGIRRAGQDRAMFLVCAAAVLAGLALQLAALAGWTVVRRSGVVPIPGGRGGAARGETAYRKESPWRAT